MTTTDTAGATTEFATSSDGTRIAFERSGSGPLLVLVDGALCFRAFGPSQSFTAELRDSFTVVSYDRRGRGESGDQPVYSPDLEVDDLRAVVAALGETPFVLGFSSGAGLAYRAAAAGVPMRKLIGYEAPFVGLRAGRDYIADLDGLIARGENGKAVDYFMVTMVGGPFFLPVMFRLMGKQWTKLKAVAPSLRYDARVMGGDFEVPTELFGRIAVPTRVIWGSKAKTEMVEAGRAIAAAVPGAETRTLDGQTHNVAPAALRPELIGFFA